MSATRWPQWRGRAAYRSLRRRRLSTGADAVVRSRRAVVGAARRRRRRAPDEPKIDYDEKAITAVVDGGGRPQTSRRRYRYSVHSTADVHARWRREPLSEPAFADAADRVGRGAVLRGAHGRDVIETVRLESEASPHVCVTPRDTFPPAQPAGLIGVASEGAISLIWDGQRRARSRRLSRPARRWSRRRRWRRSRRRRCRDQLQGHRAGRGARDLRRPGCGQGGQPQRAVEADRPRRRR